MKARNLALCGLLTALAVVLLVLGGTLSVATYAAPLLAMLALLPILEEIGPKAALTAWASVSLLGVLLVPDAELALVFAAFGWYPVLRPKLARVPSKAARLAGKLAMCNGVLLALYGLLLRLLGLTADLAGNARLLNAALLVLANIVFLLMDVVLERMTNLWHRKLRKLFMK